MKCSNCGKQTSNPKFCSRSCASTFNNRLFPKRGVDSKVCEFCGEEFKPYKGSVGICCSLECCHAKSWDDWCIEVKRTGSFPTTKNTTRPKRFLVQERGHRCELCGRKTWRGFPIDLVFDHINGNSNDWSLSNCRLVCNNCDAQLPTYKGRNQGKGRYSRKQRYGQGKSY